MVLCLTTSNLLTRHQNLQNIRILILQIYFFIFLMILRHTILDALERNIRAIRPTLMKQKNHNKRFGKLEFDYFGDSNVVNRHLGSLHMKITYYLYITIHKAEGNRSKYYYNQ